MLSICRGDLPIHHNQKSEVPSLIKKLEEEKEKGVKGELHHHQRYELDVISLMII
jgi:hypothetical protein